MQITDCLNEREPQLAFGQQEHTISKFRSWQDSFWAHFFNAKTGFKYAVAL